MMVPCLSEKTPHEATEPIKGCRRGISQRICQSCDATETSQWRYDVTGKILLCNGCGIRWRRTKRKEENRLKPGLKRAHQSARSPYGADFHKQSVVLSIKKSCASSSSTTNSILSTPTRKFVDGFSRSQDSTGHSRRSPKMDLKHLLCGTNSQLSPKLANPEESAVSSGRTNVHLSQLGIKNLINYCDEAERVRMTSDT